MERNLNTLEINEENQIVIETQDNAVCDVCGEEFQHPLLAELISGDHAEEYHACPRCLTKVIEVKHQEKIEADEADGEEEAVEVVEIQQENEPFKTQKASACPHHLGYLKKRQKNSPIPENCFTCTKMIECTR